MAGNFPDFKNMFPGGASGGTFPTFGNMFPGAAPQPAGIGPPSQLTPLQERIQRSEEEDKKRAAELARLEAEHGKLGTFATQAWRGGLSAVTAPGAIWGAGVETVGGLTGWKGLEEFGRDVGQAANGQAAMEALAFLVGGGGTEGLEKVRKIQQLVDEQQQAWPTLSTVSNIAGQAVVGLAAGGAAGLAPAATKMGVVGTEAAIGAFEASSAGAQAAYEQGAPLTDVYTSGIVGGILGGGFGAGTGALFGRPARQLVGKETARVFTRAEETEAMQGMRAAGIRASQAKRLHGRKGAEASRELDIRTGLDATNYVLRTGEHAGEHIFWKPGAMLGRKPEEIPILLEQAKDEVGVELGQMRQVLDQQIQQAQTPYARALAERQAAIADQARLTTAVRRTPGPAQIIDKLGATSERIEYLREGMRPMETFRATYRGKSPEEVNAIARGEMPYNIESTPVRKYESVADAVHGEAVDLAGGTHKEFFFADLKAQLKRVGMSEAEVDNQLTKLVQERKLVPYPIENPRELTPHRAAGAMRYGENVYHAGRFKVESATPSVRPEITARTIEPIKFEIDIDERGAQRVILRDGRHRLQAANEAGADEILATVERVDKDGNVLSSQTRPVSLKPRTAPPAMPEPPPVPQPTADMPSAVQLITRIDDEVMAPLAEDARMIPAAQSQFDEIEKNLGWLRQKALQEQQGIGAPLTFGELEIYRRNIAKYTPVYPKIPVAGLAPPTPPSLMLLKKVERMVSDHLDEKAELALRERGLDALAYRRTRQKMASLIRVTDMSANEANFRRWNQALSLKDIGVGVGTASMLAHGNVAGFMAGVAATAASKFWRERGPGIMSLWAHRASHTLTTEMSGRMGAVVPLLRGVGVTTERTIPRTIGAWSAPDRKTYDERRRKLDDFMSRPSQTVLSQQLDANPDIPDELSLPLGQQVYQKIGQLARDFPKPRSVGVKGQGSLSSEELRVANAMWDATIDPFGVFSAFQNGHVDYTRVRYTWKQWPGLKQAAQAAMIDALHQQLSEDERTQVPDPILTQLDFLLDFGGTLQGTVARGFAAQMTAAAEPQEEPIASGPPLKLPMRPNLTERLSGQRQG